MNAEKSVCVTGNTSNGPIVYNCYPVDEFSQGKWLLSIGSVSFDSSISNSATCAVTCNFVTGKKRSASGDVKIYGKPLNVFHLKTSSTSPRGIFRFCKYGNTSIRQRSFRQPSVGQPSFGQPKQNAADTDADKDGDADDDDEAAASDGNETKTATTKPTTTKITMTATTTTQTVILSIL